MDSLDVLEKILDSRFSIDSFFEKKAVCTLIITATSEIKYDKTGQTALVLLSVACIPSLELLKPSPEEFATAGLHGTEDPNCSANLSGG